MLRFSVPAQDLQDFPTLRLLTSKANETVTYAGVEEMESILLFINTKIGAPKVRVNGSHSYVLDYLLRHIPYLTI